MFQPLRWGLIPAWAKDPAIGAHTFNARAETVATKPAFRDAFRTRRCLVPVTGYFEWRDVKGGRQPFFIHKSEDRPFALAGLWD